MPSDLNSREQFDKRRQQADADRNWKAIEEFERNPPSPEKIAADTLAYQQKISGMTSHELARYLLDLPECRMVFVNGGHGAYTHDLRPASMPWHADALREVRIMVSDSMECVAK